MINWSLCFAFLSSRKTHQPSIKEPLLSGSVKPSHFVLKPSVSSAFCPLYNSYVEKTQEYTSVKSVGLNTSPPPTSVESQWRVLLREISAFTGWHVVVGNWTCLYSILSHLWTGMLIERLVSGDYGINIHHLCISVHLNLPPSPLLASSPHYSYSKSKQFRRKKIK